MEKGTKITLTGKEASVLREALAYAQFDASSLSITEQGVVLDKELAETIREICADYLMEVGFDEDYGATEKGNLLESLIDKFFMD